MEEVLEAPLEQAHRPIKKNPNMVIALKRQRGSEIIKLDSQTLLSVSLQTDAQVTENIKGNVTKYNILSGYGRFYDDNLQRTVSFKVEEDVSSTQKQLLTWSLHYAQEKEGEGKIIIDAKRIITAKGYVKRYLVSRIKPEKI